MSIVYHTFFKKGRYLIALADLIFDPTPALTRFAEDLLLKHAMITGYCSSPAYVDPFARAWLGLSTTDLGLSRIF